MKKILFALSLLVSSVCFGQVHQWFGPFKLTDTAFTSSIYRFSYDATHYAFIQVGSTGILYFIPSANTVQLPSSTTTNAGLNIGSGSAPLTPNNGDLWATSTHLYARLNSATYQIDQQGGTSYPVIGGSSGLGSNVTSLTPSGTDGFFKLTLVTSGNVTGTMGAIAFGGTWSSTPICIISAADAVTGTAVFTSTGGYMALNGTSTTTANFTAAIVGAGTYVFNCHCGK